MIPPRFLWFRLLILGVGPATPELKVVDANVGKTVELNTLSSVSHGNCIAYTMVRTVVKDGERPVTQKQYQELKCSGGLFQTPLRKPRGQRALRSLAKIGHLTYNPNDEKAGARENDID